MMMMSASDSPAVGPDGLGIIHTFEVTDMKETKTLDVFIPEPPPKEKP